MGRALLGARGLTLVEVMVSGWLMLLLLTVFLTFVGAGQRIYRQASAESELMETCAVAMQKLGMECVATNWSLLSYGNSWVAFPSAYGVEGRFVTADDGKPVWQKYVLYYVYENRFLRKEIWPDASITKSLSNSAANAARDGSGALLASEVVSFSYDVTAFQLTLKPQSGSRRAEFIYRVPRFSW